MLYDFEDQKGLSINLLLEYSKKVYTYRHYVIGFIVIPYNVFIFQTEVSTSIVLFIRVFLFESFSLSYLASNYCMRLMK